jgi:hypothetical protein
MKKIVKETLNESAKPFTYTVGDLIKKLQEFPADIPVGGEGYFGELLELEDVRLSYNHSPKFVALEIEDKGEEPD